MPKKLENGQKQGDRHEQEVGENRRQPEAVLRQLNIYTGEGHQQFKACEVRSHSLESWSENSKAPTNDNTKHCAVRQLDSQQWQTACTRRLIFRNNRRAATQKLLHEYQPKRLKLVASNCIFKQLSKTLEKVSPLRQSEERRST